MPRIPDVTSLGDRRVPTGRAPTFDDRSGDILAGAIGNAARQIGGAVTEFADHRDNFRMAKAGAEFSKLEASARQFDDNDWETYEDRYRKTLTEAKDGILKNVKQPRNREALSLELDSAIERGATAVKGVARAKEVEFGRAELGTTLDTYRTTALSVGDEESRTQNIRGAQFAIKSALDNRYIDPTDAERINKEWTQNYAEGFLSMQPAEKRIEMLEKAKGTVIDLIQPDRRAALLEAAKRENRDLTIRRESQAQEDAIVAKHGGNWTGALKAARDIDDPEVRDSTVNRIKVRQAEVMQAERDFHDGLAEQALAFLNDGGKYADLPLPIKNGLKPSELNSLRAYAEQQAGGGPRRTDPETLIELSRLSTDDPQKFGELNMLAYRDKLSDSDFEEHVDLQRKIRTGTLDGKATGFMSLNQVRDERLSEIFGSARPLSKEGDNTKEARRKFIVQYEGQLKAFREQAGKPASTDDARKILDNMTADVAINHSFWFDDTKPIYALTLDDIPDAEGQEIVAELKKHGKPVTEKAVLDWFIKANRK